MKKLLTLLIFLFLSGDAFAKRFDITANIAEIRYHGSTQTLAGSQWQDVVWFSLENLNIEPTNCRKYRNKYGIAVAKGDKDALSIALAAKLAGKKVLITLDDTIRGAHNESCLLQYITLL